MLKVINVVGARPNFMKVAPIVAAMKRRPADFLPLVVHTGQHYDRKMSDVFFEQLKFDEMEYALNIAPMTAQRVAHRYLERGFEGMLDGRRGNGSPKVDADLLQTLAELLRSSAPDDGWQRPTTGEASRSP